MPNNFRKRIIVTEGDLMQLWCEVEQVRNVEKKEAFKLKFKELLREAELVKLTVLKKEVTNDRI